MSEQMTLDKAVEVLGYLVDKCGTIRKKEALEVIQKHLELLKKSDLCDVCKHKDEMCIYKSRCCTCQDNAKFELEG